MSCGAWVPVLWGVGSGLGGFRFGGYITICTQTRPQHRAHFAPLQLSRERERAPPLVLYGGRGCGGLYTTSSRLDVDTRASKRCETWILRSKNGKRGFRRGFLRMKRPLERLATSDFSPEPGTAVHLRQNAHEDTGATTPVDNDTEPKRGEGHRNAEKDTKTEVARRSPQDIVAS